MLPSPKSRRICQRQNMKFVHEQLSYQRLLAIEFGFELK